MNFWDASAIVPLFVAERATHEARAWFAEMDGGMSIWALTALEVRSALARRAREGALSEDAALTVADEVDALLEGAAVVRAGDEVIGLAKRLLFVHPLRAADACQLAAALVATRHRPRGSHFYCVDKTLRGAARVEGFLTAG